MQQKTSARKKLVKYIRGADIFGSQISLLYKGESTFKTTLGGFSTIFAVTLLFAYFLQQVNQIVDKQVTLQTFSTFINTDSASTPPINITRDLFDIALDFKIKDSNFSKEKLDEYLTVQFAHISVTSENGEAESEKLYPKVTLCNGSDWEYDESVSLLRGEYGYFFCPEQLDLQILGSPISSNVKRFVIQVGKCSQTNLNRLYPGQNKTCKNDTEFDLFKQATRISLAVKNTYFDSQEFEGNPIKSQIDHYSVTLLEGFIQMSIFKIGEHSASTADGWFFNFFSNDYTFLRASKSDVYSHDWSSTVLYQNIAFFQNEEVLQTSRTRMTLWDAFSNTGGLLGIVVSFVSVGVASLQDAQYQSKLIEKLYLHKKKGAAGDTKSKVWPSTSPEGTSSHVLKDLEGRVPFEYSLWDYIYGRVCCRRQAKKRLFLRGVEKLEQSLDIAKVADVLRKVDLIMQLFLSKQQRHLLNFANDRLLEVSENDQVSALGKKFRQLIAQKSHQQVLKECVESVVNNSAKDQKLAERILKRISVGGKVGGRQGELGQESLADLNLKSDVEEMFENIGKGL